MVDVLLVNPPPLRRFGPAKEHLGLGYLAASLRQSDFSVRVIDAAVFEMDFDALNAELDRETFSVLGVSILFQDSLRMVLDWLTELRTGGLVAHTTIGGHPATFTYLPILEAYDCVDSVVRGEGEITLVELTEKVVSGGDWRAVDGIAYRGATEVIANPLRPLIADLDSLPRPARDVYAARPGAFEQVAAVSTRGCHEYCSFCSIASFYRSSKGRVWRRRQPEAVLDEIDDVQRIAPSPFVMLFDDSFIGPGKIGRRQAFEFAEVLGGRRADYALSVSCRADQVEEELFRELKRAGLKSVFLGIESGNDETLDLFNKDTDVQSNRHALRILQKLDFAVEIGFIMFNPYTTFDKVRADLDFLLETGSGPDVRNFANLGFFPGQQLLKTVEADGLLHGSPFGYESSFSDSRVGDFFLAIRDNVFSGWRAPGLRLAHQMIQAAQIEYDTPPPEILDQAKNVLTGFYRIVYDTAMSAAALFEADRADSLNISAIENDFTARITALSSEMESAVAGSRQATL